MALIPNALAEHDGGILNSVVYKDHELYLSQSKIPINFSMSLEESAGAYINHNISARMDDDSYLLIDVKDNAFFQINTTGSLDLRNNVTMILEGNSTLILNGGVLNVSENATLIIKENAKIVINDSGRLQIYGSYSISCDTITVKNAQLYGLYVDHVNQVILKSSELGDFNISACSLFSAEDSQIFSIEIAMVDTFRASNTLSEKSISSMVLKNVQNVSLDDVNIDTVTIDNCGNFTAKSLFSAKMTKLTVSHLGKFVLDGYNATNLTVHAYEVVLKNSKIRGNEGELSTLTEAVSFQMFDCTFDKGLTFGSNSSVVLVNSTIPLLKATENATIELYGWYPSKEVDKDKFEAQNVIVLENASVRIYRWLTVYVANKNNTPIAGATAIVIDSTGKNEVGRVNTNTTGYAVFLLYSERITCVNGTNNDVFQGWYTVKVVYESLRPSPETHSAIMNDSMEVRFVMEVPEEPPQENMWLVAGIIIVIIVVLLLTYYFFSMTKKDEEVHVHEKEKKKKEEWKTDAKPKFKEPPKEWHEKEEK
ncbi:MAG: hypothetical protein N3F63_00530 [Thermoplasmata archaeon]|nr:hypothetical protein [Thermoplasmata archaeon]